mmetsp:Transcript_40910/g.69940  ORF Transcript_40910/g.69940 Transcript_40910/m.69940 type:complete len:620 (-) Transcript_40910:116-1975(-)
MMPELSSIEDNTHPKNHHHHAASLPIAASGLSTLSETPATATTTATASTADDADATFSPAPIRSTRLSRTNHATTTTTATNNTSSITSTTTTPTKRPPSINNGQRRVSWIKSDWSSNSYISSSFKASQSSTYQVLDLSSDLPDESSHNPEGGSGNYNNDPNNSNKNSNSSGGGDGDGSSDINDGNTTTNNNNGCGQSSSSHKNNDSRPTILPLSNNFENYWKMKMQSSRSSRHHHDDEQQQNEEAEGPPPESQEWNHFTTPLSNSSSSSASSSSQQSSSYLQTTTTTTTDPKQYSATTTPLVFSDMERSRTLDRFSTIFMERMGNAMSNGKLSQAWQSQGSGDDGIFSWLLKDYSPQANSNSQSTSLSNKPNNNTVIHPEEYAAEKKRITPHLTPMIWGTSCMMVTLFSLRLGRWYQGAAGGRRNLSYLGGHHRASSGSGGGSNGVKSLQDVRQTLSRQNNHQGYSSNSNNNNPFNPRQEAKKKLISSLTTLPVDMAISMLVGISTSIFLTDTSSLMRDVSTLPLVEGKSVLAEELCEPFATEMERVNGMDHLYTSSWTGGSTDDMDGDGDGDGVVAQKKVVSYAELWKDENLNDFDSLRSIRDFVVNCHEREKKQARR